MLDTKPQIWIAWTISAKKRWSTPSRHYPPSTCTLWKNTNVGPPSPITPTAFWTIPRRSGRPTAASTLGSSTGPIREVGIRPKKWPFSTKAKLTNIPWFRVRPAEAEARGSPDVGFRTMMSGFLSTWWAATLRGTRGVSRFSRSLLKCPSVAVHRAPYVLLVISLNFIFCPMPIDMLTSTGIMNSWI